MTEVHEFDLTLPDGRTLHGYDIGGDGVPVMWHHGTPNTGAPPKPLFASADELGLRWVSFDRPGYGGSTAHSGRTIATVAADAAALADALGIDRFAVIGHSGGGPHALGCAALQPARISAVVSLGGLAPFEADGIDWFAGMGPTSNASLRAAVTGFEGKRLHEQESADAPIDFTARDWKALTGEWGWLSEVAAAGMASGIDALIDDDLAYVTPWGVDLADIVSPVLLAHGADDHVVPASHSRWLAQHVSGAEHWELPGESHISSLAADEHGAADALRWLADRVRHHGSVDAA
jgi:pimeloyl-ACP methyl ester carboxylesterase